VWDHGRVDPVTVIVTALSAGATTALGDGVAQAIKDAYAKLKVLTRLRFSSRPKGELVLAEHEADPTTWEAPLKAELTSAGAAGDAELMAAAQALLTLVDEAGTLAGKYRVTVSDAQGVQIGDYNVQHNTFGGSGNAKLT
jgi:hypothetical protein